MVKFPYEAIERLVLSKWDDKDVQLIVFYIGIGSLMWLVWDGSNFVAHAEVQGITPSETSKAKYTENFFLLPTRRLIQVKVDTPSVQLMKDKDLLAAADILTKKRIAEPKFQPYDAEWEVLDHERTRRWNVRNGEARRPLHRLGDAGIVDL